MATALYTYSINVKGLVIGSQAASDAVCAPVAFSCKPGIRYAAFQKSKDFITIAPAILGLGASQ